MRVLDNVWLPANRTRAATHLSGNEPEWQRTRVATHLSGNKVSQRMTPLQKFKKITKWFADNAEQGARRLTPQRDYSLVEQIEALCGETFPADLQKLYRSFDGDEGEGASPFLGHRLVSLSRMVRQLEFSRGLIKPENPVVSDPGRSEEIIRAICDAYRSEVPSKKFLGLFKTQWYKLVFGCSPLSLSGPYLYRRPDPFSGHPEILELSNPTRFKVYELAGQLHELEKAGYNWDELKVTLYGDGRAEVERSFDDFDAVTPLTSFPADAIKLKYFHIKWLPVIEDVSGNYIGIDLDPGPAGTSGQVIVYGSDDDDMFVLAPSWDGFLDLVLRQIKEDPQAFLSGEHLHDYFRELITGA